MARRREFEPETMLNGAVLRFWERGYRATSIEDLVKATGVKPGGTCSAFPGGKRALFESHVAFWHGVTVEGAQEPRA